MTAAAASGPAEPPTSEIDSPRAIRAALLTEEVGQFDSEWRRAMARSAEALDLTEVHTVLDRWRRIARLTLADPEAHRRMLRRAERVSAGADDDTTITGEDLRELLAGRLGG